MESQMVLKQRGQVDTSGCLNQCYLEAGEQTENKLTCFTSPHRIPTISILFFFLLLVNAAVAFKKKNKIYISCLQNMLM